MYKKDYIKQRGKNKHRNLHKWEEQRQQDGGGLTASARAGRRTEALSAQ